MSLRSLVLVAVLASGPVSVAAQAEPDTVRGRVIDGGTGRAVSGALVRSMPGAHATETDSVGAFELATSPGGAARLSVSAYGYETLDTLLSRPLPNDLRVSLEPVPVRLRPLTVQASRIPRDGPSRERALFDREVTPGVVGMGAPEMREAPVAVEPDVLRSLQALPGVVALNDLAAQLHVRGGGADQNAFYLDGARVFAPYHTFGLFGAFNTEAIDRTEMYRGAFPARFGGALSSVVDVRQRVGVDQVDNEETPNPEGAGGLSLMGARLAVRGSDPSAGLHWGIGARRTHADLTLGSFTAPDEFPFRFHDVQGRMELERSESRLAISGFHSSDRFRMFLDEAEGGLRSSWANRAGSLQWNTPLGTDWELTAVGWASGYEGDLSVGDPGVAQATSSDVSAVGLRLGAARRGELGGFRTGLDMEWTRASLVGSPDSVGYVVGEDRSRVLRSALYFEGDRWLGPLRLSPGIRGILQSSGPSVLLEPRLAARLHVAPDLALTVGWSRTHQPLFALRDDRYLLPGAPLWMDASRGGDAPPSRADGATISLEGWSARTWSFEVTGYHRKFRALPRWRPEGRRDLDQVRFDDGRAWGGEVFVRRHEGVVTGWLGYSIAGVRMESSASADEYRAAWDRRHAVDATALLRPGESFSLSLRLTYGSGLPFWPPAGTVDGRRYDPILGQTAQGDAYPVWADSQSRFPSYLRLDVGARMPFRVGGLRVEPYLSVLNATNHGNVLFYETGQAAPDGPPVLRPTLQLPFIPIIGFDLSF